MRLRAILVSGRLVIRGMHFGISRSATWRTPQCVCSLPNWYFTVTKMILAWLVWTIRNLISSLYIEQLTFWWQKFGFVDCVMCANQKAEHVSNHRSIFEWFYLHIWIPARDFEILLNMLPFFRLHHSVVLCQVLLEMKC